MDFLAVSAALIDHPQADEAFYRSAISRQYYALFLLARDKLGINDDSPDTHRAVIEALRARSGKAGVYLSTLRRDRNLADYGGGKLIDWLKSARLHQSMAASMARTIDGLK